MGTWLLSVAALIVGLGLLGIALFPQVHRIFFGDPGSNSEFVFNGGVEAIASIYQKTPVEHRFVPFGSKLSFPFADSTFRGLIPSNPPLTGPLPATDSTGLIWIIWYQNEVAAFVAFLPNTFFSRSSKPTHIDTLYPGTDSMRASPYYADTLDLRLVRAAGLFPYFSVHYEPYSHSEGNLRQVRSLIAAYVEHSNGAEDTALNRTVTDTLYNRALVAVYGTRHLAAPLSWALVSVSLFCFFFTGWWWWAAAPSLIRLTREAKELFALHMSYCETHGFEFSAPYAHVSEILSRKRGVTMMFVYQSILDGELSAFQYGARAVIAARAREERRKHKHQEVDAMIAAFKVRLGKTEGLAIPAGIAAELQRAEDHAISPGERRNALEQAQWQLNWLTQPRSENSNANDYERQLWDRIHAIPDSKRTAAQTEWIKLAEGMKSRLSTRIYYLEKALGLHEALGQPDSPATPRQPVTAGAMDQEVIMSEDELFQQLAGRIRGYIPHPIDVGHVTWILLALGSPLGGIPYILNSYTYLENIQRDVAHKIVFFDQEQFDKAFQWLRTHKIVLLFKFTRSRQGYSLNIHAKKASSIGRPIVEQTVRLLHEVQVRTT
ncbi:MAG: hypothetical protein PHY34_02370 [Patescibacteria group bacterium]|nr:hypothetical protein [Patescibacteria group bacterium]